MGDVISITDAQGEELVEYEYDEWGKICSTYLIEDEYADIAQINPIRYRGYYYDTETGYYYLQSRYYDPSICRFINSDVLEITKKLKDDYLGTNVFCYCKSNPINLMDFDGKIAALSVYTIAKIIVTVLSVIGIYLIAASIINSTTYDSVKSGISSLHSSFGLSTTGIINILSVFITTTYEYTKTQISSKTKAATKALNISIADAKVKTTVSRERKSAYWIVYRGDGYIYLGNKISRNQAINLLKSGYWVFSTSKYNAKNIATAASNGNTPWGPEIHGDSGYFWHYHLYKHINDSHSFYL